MVDWTTPMIQTFEFHIVDPSSWKDIKKLDKVTAGTIDRDLTVDTLGSASIDVKEDIGEHYVRIYLVTIQNGKTEKHPLGVFLFQSPNKEFDGKIESLSMDGYTPLIELKEKLPDIGFFIPKHTEEKPVDIMETIYKLIKDNDLMRGPVIEPIIPSTKLTYDFISNENDNWLIFLKDLLTAAYTSTCYVVNKDTDIYKRTTQVIKEPDGSLCKGIKTTSNEQVYITSDGIYYCIVENLTQYRFDLDELGRVMFAPNQDVKGMTPIWTYTDDNSSILYPELTIDRDIYGIPNVLQVVYSSEKIYYEHTVENNDPDSPVSTVARGRKIIQRITNPELYGTPTKERIKQYAEQKLSELSSIECTLTYTHGYCPVRPGDCVRLNYSLAGLNNVKAKVISQHIKLEPGCPVTEKATTTIKLWG